MIANGGKMRTRSIIAVIIAIVVPLLLWAGADILEFTAEAQGDAISLNWRTGVEVNLHKFQVQRSINGTTYFTIGEVEPTGSYSEYHYLDNLLSDSFRLYYYRLKIVDNSGAVSYSEVREVTISFSGIQQTWGSIKAMFR
jgi:hypothetical protein